MKRRYYHLLLYVNSSFAILYQRVALCGLTQLRINIININLHEYVCWPSMPNGKIFQIIILTLETHIILLLSAKDMLYELLHLLLN
jgi:hypothetical protein